MKILVLDDDDVRHRSFASHLSVNHFVTHVHTYKEFVRAITSCTFDVIFLDHDLNYQQYESKAQDGRELTGYDCALFLIKDVPRETLPQHVVIHSHNAGGAMHMNGVLKSAGIVPIIWFFLPSQHPLQAAGIENAVAPSSSGSNPACGSI